MQEESHAHDDNIVSKLNFFVSAQGFSLLVKSLYTSERELLRSGQEGYCRESYSCLLRIVSEVLKRKTEIQVNMEQLNEMLSFSGKILLLAGKFLL